MDLNKNFSEKGLDKILYIKRNRAKTLEELKKALQSNDLEGIRLYASYLCGLKNESNRAS